tara:strand:- start:60657 stop:61490 length:834 start_codon:yes stop_codon:yes gene_type:complete
MERLQAAIEKARREQPEAVQTSSMSDGQRVENLWSALPMLELKPSILRRNRIYTSQAATPEAVSFDIMRTRTLRLMQENGWRRLAITSPTASCGKSTLTLNLAFSMARQRDTRTVQVELDMRRPSQSKLMGLSLSSEDKSASAVEKLLTGQAGFAEAAKQAKPGLAMVNSARSVENASDILLDKNVPLVLDNIETQYQPDMMLFDMPPTLLNDDTAAFLKHVDCVLIVAAAEQSTAAEIDHCEREIAAQTNVLGVVLNKFRLSSSEYSGYNYAYKYK